VGWGQLKYEISEKDEDKDKSIDQFNNSRKQRRRQMNDFKKMETK